MKRITSLALALALTAALFTGCGCSNVSTHPGGMITEESTRPTVMPTPTATHETARPTETTHATMPTVTGSDPTDGGSVPNGSDGNSQNGGTGNSTGATGSNGTTGGAGSNESTTPSDTTGNSRSRGRMPNR